jgi:hypothetical protein
MDATALVSSTSSLSIRMEVADVDDLPKIHPSIFLFLCQ